MFGIGFFELVLIAVAVLVFVGPQKLPEVMRQAGKLFVQLRRTANDVRGTFDQVIRDAEDEIRKEEQAALKELLAAKAAVSVDTMTTTATALPTSTTPASEALPGTQAMAQPGAIYAGELDPRKLIDPHHADPHHADPHHADPHHADPHHADPHHADPHHADPHHADPHHAGPQHTDTSPEPAAQPAEPPLALPASEPK